MASKEDPNLAHGNDWLRREVRIFKEMRDILRDAAMSATLVRRQQPPVFRGLNPDRGQHRDACAAVRLGQVGPVGAYPKTILSQSGQLYIARQWVAQHNTRGRS